jgi:hypothetical protein
MLGEAVADNDLLSGAGEELVCVAKRGRAINCMATVHDFVADWIEIRSKLQRQLKVLESGEMSTGAAANGGTTEATRTRIKKCIDERNALLREYARADWT